jgi:cyclophilin family peptidyl-prolyl cis-trans isomerase
MKATLKTNKGDIVIDFFGDRTPATVENFIKLAKSGFYDGVKFHRVIPNFMIQGGDPLTKEDAKMAYWGTGGPGYKFNDEITPANSNATGTISMANAGRNTNGSQFFINLSDNHFLNDKHTAFGQVTGGMDVVKAIGVTPTGHSDRPIDAVVINSIVVEEN